MKKIYISLLAFLVTQIMLGQLVINELDSDTPSTDTHEFIEIKSENPYFPLDGFVIVLFNGSSSGGNTSYQSMDLSGYATDINGLLLIGSNDVVPTPQYLLSENTIQNGADAVGIYIGTPADFPSGTLATTDNLLDAIVYGTGDDDATGLMSLLGESQQYDEDENGDQTLHSIQVSDDGSFFVATPTPGELNEGGGTLQNGIEISTSQEEYNEGEIIEIVFTSDEILEEDLTFNFALENGGFDATDFSGNTSVSILQGTDIATSTIEIIDDTADEGDEDLVVYVSDVAEDYLVLNNYLEVRIADNDYTVAAWGTPVNPTYGIVESTQPDGYYGSLDGLAGEELEQALQDIIADEDVVRTQTYADVIDILKEADQNPENSNQVWLVYSEQGRSKIDLQTTSASTGKWNREHTYPRSRGGFYSMGADANADGPDEYWETHADSLRHGNSDAHALRASDGPENSSRGNQHYGQYTGPEGTAGSFKGEVARSVLYMAIRYNDLNVVNGCPEVTGQMGDLTTILDWHRNDPPDDYEMNRNNVVYTWQYNRNPFIDQPDLVEYIWGENAGENWDQEMNTADYEILQVQMYPNPAVNRVKFEGIDGRFSIKIFSAKGKQLISQENLQNNEIQLNLSSGIYFVKITSEGKSTVRKLLIK